MRTRTKVALVILLVLWYFLLCLHFCPKKEPVTLPALSNVDLPKDLDKWFEGTNSEFFDEKLPKDTVIDWGEYDNDRMGSTTILPDGRFHIAFNEKYCLATRVAHLVLLHEECHVFTFSEIKKNDPASEHGPRWRTCMLNLYQQGAFKSDLIDGYKGDR